MKTLRLRYIGVIFAFSVGVAMAQETPLSFGATNAIVDEFGQVLPGRNPSCTYWGLDPVSGPIVQILQTLDGSIYPANPDGSPGNTNNLVIQTIRIGEGVDGSLSESGLFSGTLGYFRRSSMMVSPKIFARVFNGVSEAESSFYGDSQVFDVPVFGDDYDRFFAQIEATDQPLDTSDLDQDGMIGSWEKSFGTDPNNPDSDRDGVRDGDEMLAGTDALDDTSFLAMVELIPYNAKDLMVMWASVSGTVYQLQISTNGLMDPVFDPVNATIEATDTVAGTVVTNAQEWSDVHFRVRVITP